MRGLRIRSKYGISIYLIRVKPVRGQRSQERPEVAPQLYIDRGILKYNEEDLGATWAVLSWLQEFGRINRNQI